MHCINSVSDGGLCMLFGKNNLDSSYVIRGTIQFWLHEKAAIKECVSVGIYRLENQINSLFTDHLKPVTSVHV